MRTPDRTPEQSAERAHAYARASGLPCPAGCPHCTAAALCTMQKLSAVSPRALALASRPFTEAELAAADRAIGRAMLGVR